MPALHPLKRDNAVEPLYYLDTLVNHFTPERVIQAIRDNHAPRQYGHTSAARSEYEAACRRWTAMSDEEIFCWMYRRYPSSHSDAEIKARYQAVLEGEGWPLEVASYFLMLSPEILSEIPGIYDWVDPSP